jgi:hypothetical protein
MATVVDLLKDLSGDDIHPETCLTSLSLLENHLGSVVSASEVALAKENLVSRLAPILKQYAKDLAFNDFVARGAGKIVFTKLLGKNVL